MRLRLDIGRAILALSLASALWIAVQNEQNPEQTGVPAFAVPVEVVNVPSGQVVVSEQPQIQVRVRIPNESWNLLRPASFRATADGSQISPGVIDLPVHVEALDPQVRTVDPIPPQVSIAVEEVIERIVPVRLNIAGSVPFGYAYTSPVVTPENLTVAGPSSAVQRVEAAVIEIRLDGLTIGLNATYAPRPVDARGEAVRSIRTIPPTVNVEVPVAQQVGYKEVGVRPQIRGQVAAGYFLQPVEIEPASVTVVGSPATLAGINFVNTEPVDVAGIATSVVRRVQVQPPAGLSLLQPQPVNVTLRVSPLVTTQTLRVVPTLQNTGAGLQIATDSPIAPIDITLTGSAPTLQSLTPNDFQVIVDLSGLRAGRHEIEPRISVPGGFTLDRVEPQRVVVVLRDIPTPISTPTRVEPVFPPTPVATPSP